MASRDGVIGREKHYGVGERDESETEKGEEDEELERTKKEKTARLAQLQPYSIVGI